MADEGRDITSCPSSSLEVGMFSVVKRWMARRKFPTINPHTQDIGDTRPLTLADQLIYTSMSLRAPSDPERLAHAMMLTAQRTGIPVERFWDMDLADIYALSNRVILDVGTRLAALAKSQREIANMLNQEQGRVS